MRRADGLFAMDNDERYVSPYLLRPLRTLEEVLGGRGTAAETARGGIDVTATGGDQVDNRVEDHRSAQLRATD
jgi:hypothetical protein